MKTIIRSLALAGILVATTVPAFADEIVKSYSYAIDGVPLPTQRVSVEDIDLSKRPILMLEEPQPVVKTTTEVIRTNSAVIETTKFTVRRDDAPTVRTVETLRVGHGPEYTVKEFGAVIESDSAPVIHEQHSQYWPLLDYSYFGH